MRFKYFCLPIFLFRHSIISPFTQMSTLNCRADMHSSSYSKELQHYFSPSNSSLLIQVPEGTLKCTPGQSGTYNMPVFFSATNQPRATFTVQVGAW